MKNIDKHEFDELFRGGLSAPDLTEVDEDWALMKVRLEKGGMRSPLPYYLLLMSSVAAVLILIFSLTFNENETELNEAAFDVKRVGESRAEVQNGNVLFDAGTSTTASDNTSVLNLIQDLDIETITSNIPAPVAIGPAPVPVQTDLVSNTVILSTQESSSSFNSVAATNAEASPNDTVLNATTFSEELKIPFETAASSLEEELISPRPSSTKRRLSLAINFAPDLSGVERFQNNRVSYSIGAGAIYALSNKLSLEAGAAYGKKTYQTGFSSFRPAIKNLFQVKPNVVRSGFDVMDLHLNMSYTLLTKGKSSIGFGAGVSSYLMLDEQYSFTYQNMNARGLSWFRTGYQNNHFFGIANLYLSYKRNLSKNVKLAFNPYLKLPLTDLGYGNIRLRSAGMSLGIITNLNKSKK